MIFVLKYLLSLFHQITIKPHKMKNTFIQIKKELSQLNGKDIYILTLLCIMIIFISTFVINNL